MKNISIKNTTVKWFEYSASFVLENNEGIWSLDSFTKDLEVIRNVFDEEVK